MPVVYFYLSIILFIQGCSSQIELADRKYPSRFRINVVDDLLETHDGNTFSANLHGIHPVFGNALRIKARGVSVESIKNSDSKKASLAFRQWHRFSELLKEAKIVEVRDLERGTNGFWVLADVYIDGVLFSGAP